jgi:hypothetical protein
MPIDLTSGQPDPSVVTKAVCNRIAPIASKISGSNFDAGRGLAAFIFRDIEKVLNPSDNALIMPASDDITNVLLMIN